MNYKGFRVDRKFNVYDLNGNLLFEKIGNFEIAKEKIDKYLETQHHNHKTNAFAKSNN